MIGGASMTIPFAFQNKSQDLFIGENFVGRNGVWLVVALSGVFGLIFGLAYSTWHEMVTGAQIVAGVVSYPRENPFRMTHAKAWIIMNQVGALALLSGISEKTLSIMVSGFMGMLSFQALSLFVFALSGNILVSILIPFFMQFTEVAFFGIGYSIRLLGHFWAYGVVGLGFSD